MGADSSHFPLASIMAKVSFLPLLLLLLLALCITTSCQENEIESTCSVSYDTSDPNLKPLTYDVGDGPQTKLVYVTPHVTSFYKGTPPAKTAVKPKHKGLAAKFINMSNKKVRLYWEPTLNSKSKSLMRVIPPFAATGSASFPGHLFFLTPQNDPNTIIHRWEVGAYPDNVYVYDPYLVAGDDAATLNNLKTFLSEEERPLYDGWNRTRTFHDIYRNFTGRSYLANYLRAPPTHFMWPADHFGQQHWITTRETHFTQMPPKELLGKIGHYGTSRVMQEGQPRVLVEYRNTSSSLLNLTLKVLSCAPRVFEIENFLSPIEVAHILHIAAGVDLKLSLTGDIKPGEETVVVESAEGTAQTRTSYNTWVEREESPIVDAIYRRGADLLRIDEALMRYRPDGERRDMPSNSSIAEHLQLVHYDPTQEVRAPRVFVSFECNFTIA
jgi:hypothetical protein